MIDEKDIKVGLEFCLRFDDCPDVFAGVVLGGYTDGQFMCFTVTEKLPAEDMWQVRVMDRENKGTLLPISEMDIHNLGRHVGYDVALRYMNEQRSKSFANEEIKRFEAITTKMLYTYKAKNHDYGNAFSEMYDELGINYGYGKIREKVNRIKVLKDNDAQVANEPLEDALLDCANYCILTLMEYKKRKKDGKD